LFDYFDRDVSPNLDGFGTIFCAGQGAAVESIGSNLAQKRYTQPAETRASTVMELPMGYRLPVLIS
jgi:hypothetical protein